MSDDQTTSDRERGSASMAAVMGTDPVTPTDAYTEFTVDHLFGKVWTREGLPRRDRRLVTLTAVAFSGQAVPLAGHLTGALKSGDLTPDELHEWVRTSPTTRAGPSRRPRT